MAEESGVRLRNDRVWAGTAHRLRFGIRLFLLLRRYGCHRFGILVLHWFNPLVWLAFALMGRDMEMSCDEAVLKSRAGSEKA